MLKRRALHRHRQARMLTYRVSKPVEPEATSGGDNGRRTRTRYGTTGNNRGEGNGSAHLRAPRAEGEVYTAAAWTDSYCCRCASVRSLIEAAGTTPSFF